jgi:hypothetical protein
MTTGFRYLKERSKASIVRSSISWGVDGREDDGLRVAVAEAAAGELDVGLLRGDVPEAGAAAHDVDEDARAPRRRSCRRHPRASG